MHMYKAVNWFEFFYYWGFWARLHTQKNPSTVQHCMKHVITMFKM